MATKIQVGFAATDKYIQDSIVLPIEEKLSGKDWVSWGRRNDYPKYLESLYNDCPTLRSIINGNVDFICGDNVTSSISLLNGKVNKAGDTLADILREVAFSVEKYNGFAFQVIRNMEGVPAEIYALDVASLRMNETGDVFYYSESWDAYSRKDKVVAYPTYLPNLDWGRLTDDQKRAMISSVHYVKCSRGSLYPTPQYAASVKACEIERSIDDFHLNAIANGFTPSAILNFCNGVPEDEQKNDIERNVNEKFSGSGNAGRVIIAFNEDKEHMATFEKLDVTDYGEKYQTLAKHSRQQIFTAFRANPNLFGIPTESLGFSSEEYDSCFRLYNRTQIRPIQRIICDAFDYIFNGRGVITIVPFTLDGEGEKTIN